MLLVMKEIGRAVILMVSEFLPSLTAADMKVAGIKENIMERVYILLHLEQNTTVIGKWASIMVQGALYGLMVQYIKVSGGIAERTEEENFQELMELFMKENGKMESTTAKAS